MAEGVLKKLLTSTRLCNLMLRLLLEPVLASLTKKQSQMQQKVMQD